ncbi:calcium-binding protein [Chachezhania sediminis]|uniref:calcium-binding protein n=1 Tax=Chachezhania sediminis TaxID=2599291 RepID=UPI001E31D8F7|nr:calcium-binding protein [Chachezhania sediminis]
MTLIMRTWLTNRVVLTGNDDLFISEGYGVETKRGKAVSATEGDHKIVVDGSIVSGGIAVSMTEDVGSIELLINKTGVIRGFDKAIVIDGEGANVANAGSIYGSIRFRHEAEDAEATEFINTGTITADGVSISGKSEIDVINFGTILGEVKLSSADDSFAAMEGSLVAFVSGGKGDDDYITQVEYLAIEERKDGGHDTVQSFVDFRLPRFVEELQLVGSGDTAGVGNGMVNTIGGNAGDNFLDGRGGDDLILGRGGDDYIDGGTGDDKLNGGAGDDIAYGGMGEDELYGRQGRDQLFGGGGEDVLVGGGGADLLEGGVGDDILNGQAGNDVLEGNQGSDVMLGRNGSDILIGGLGGDTMFGGSGADSFVYMRQADSLRSDMDDIRDFTSGKDVLDFSDFAVEILAVEIGGGSSADPVLGPSIGTTSKGGNTIVFVDTDGDGQRDDMAIFLDGTASVSVSDFVLV